jgi:hypothetical protein
MLSLVLAAILEANTPSVVKTLQPLRELPIEAGTDALTFPYARDAEYEYIGTTHGLYRAGRIAVDPFEHIAFAGEAVNALATAEGALYASRGRINLASAPEHSLLKSTDRGVTFMPVDAGLLDCASTPCGYLIPRRIHLFEGRIFTNPSGNVLVSGDEGANWSHLFGLPYNGKPTVNTCSVTFERLGANRVLLGGECPLDVGFLSFGSLRPDQLGWAIDPVAAITPEMENRNVQFIREAADGHVYAGVEGGLLRSTDGGVSYDWILHYPLDAQDRYPYIAHLLVVPELMIAGGFDKKNDAGYLAFSNDGGATWHDVSPMTGGGKVGLLVEDRDGRIIAGLQDGDRLVLAELVLGPAGKKRSVRH